ncbi:exonuclease SbcCD subunit D [Conexibacter woesei]|uniref:Nuclease SbcCD subunit D n=1 Tax=Conexibacter woesei (strain DSM 14684 / CCUG 47730 / CIP 108061 / JCM 11494 / NBRC 100937 / ID131577) TaxID=469383 RepID=D3FBW5_CONWI|nr:exonuclease SbcCD subunit D [Conexibacter woesei]ADB51380.1 nuclease SbcCD, D subunit [Conexibacter woesei DSM 14684]
MTRLLHTADWHLGRAFHGEDLLSEQAAFVDFAVATARAERVDGILIAGDLYDRALPPVDAVRLASDALARLSEIAPVVVISGNHDSAARLGFGAELLARAGVHVVTDPASAGTAVEVGGALVYPLPYLEPDLVREELGVQERSHAAVTGAAMERVRADIARRRSAAGSAPVVVMAHAFVSGAAGSESERDLAVGGAAHVPPGTFAGADYVALGHLHGPQIAGGAACRYAGSPLAFSFSEAPQRKSVALVDVGAAGAPVGVELLPCPVPRPLAALRGTLDELLADPRLRERESAWVQATLTDPVRPSDAMERLRRRFPHAVALAFDPQGGQSAPGDSYQRLRGLDDDELVRRFIADVRGSEADDDELELLRDALTARRIAEAEGQPAAAAA